MIKRTMSLTNGPTGAAAPICLYDFDGTAQALDDRTPNGMDLSLDDVSPLGPYVTEGDLTGLKFNTTARLAAANSNLTRLSGAITWETLLRHDSLSGIQQIIAQEDGGELNSQNYLWSTTLDGSSIRIFTEYGPGTNQIRVVPGFAFDLVTQYHVLVTRDSNGLDYRVFVNGVKVDDFSFLNTVNGGSLSRLIIGESTNASFPFPWFGVMYGARVTLESWSDAQAIEAYQNLLLTEKPFISDQSPAPGDVGVAPDASVLLSVVDNSGDLDNESVRVSLNGQLAYTGQRPMPGWSLDPTAVSSPDGLRYNIKPASPFEPGIQTVSVQASDTSGNDLDESYTFTTTVAADTNFETTFDAQTSGVDLLLDTSRDISVSSADLQLVTGIDEVVQHLGVGLRLFRGDWFLESESGIPYYSNVLVNNPNTRTIEGIFRQNIIGDSDVEELSSFQMTLDRSTRSLAVSFKAKSRVGVVEVSSVFP